MAVSLATSRQGLNNQGFRVSTSLWKPQVIHLPLPQRLLEHRELFLMSAKAHPPLPLLPLLLHYLAIQQHQAKPTLHSSQTLGRHPQSLARPSQLSLLRISMQHPLMLQLQHRRRLIQIHRGPLSELVHLPHHRLLPQLVQRPLPYSRSGPLQVPRLAPEAPQQQQLPVNLHQACFKV